MGRKKIIIIGAGIAGLSAGCYAQMNGYDTLILEMADRPGGVCTSWKRKGYIFDYCIHNLAGTGNSSGVRQVWDELGALNNSGIINHELFVRVEGPAGEKLNLYSDLSRLEKHLKEISPGDAKLIEEYIFAARSVAGADFFAMAMGGIKRRIGMLTHMLTFIKWGGVTLEDYAGRFANPFLRRAFPHVQYNISGSEMPMLLHLVFMAGLDKGDLGWPDGGSLGFSRRIEKRFTGIGGQVNYGSRVQKIIVREGRAIGVRLEGGDELSADIIISAADGYSTIYQMLDGKYTDSLIESYYRVYPESQDFGLQLFLGLNRDLPDEPHAVTLLLEKPVKLGAEKRDSIYLELSKSETGLAPGGKSVVKAVSAGNYRYWSSLRTDMERYSEEKNQFFEAVLEVLEKRFPGIRGQVEVVDVTTPVTVERYTGNFHGWQPWWPKEGGQKVMRKGLSKTLPGLKNFYMTGQWAGAMLGISNAAIISRNLIRDICQKDGRKFITITAQ